MRKVIVSAGDAITARLVEEAGFDGIWISGFEVSTRMGLPDNGSITMTEMLSVCKPIVETVKIPVYVDVDTGYGNFKRTVREFENIGITGICVEDVEPAYKQNSLWGDKIPLMNMNKFADKINVSRTSLQIIARTEALVRGYGYIEALERLEEYAWAKADILLPHSRTQPLQVPQGKHKWAIVPTKFPHYTNQQLFNMGYGMVIWANQAERVKIKAIREALKILKKDDCAMNIENKLSATLDDMRNLV